jgi:spore germination cell wall hydrolase CwlJ-like protein
MMRAVLRLSPDLRLPEWRAADLRAIGAGIVEGARRQWAGLGILAVSLALYGLAALSLSVPGGGLVAGAPLPGSPEALAAAAGENATALLNPQAIRPLDPNSAQQINAAMPIAGAGAAASPFALRFASDADRARSIQCLTEAVYYEAATEPVDGQRAVAQVVLNRMRHPAYPNSVCGVVFQGSERRTGCQFSFTCDGALGRAPMPALWNRAREIAEAAVAGYVYRPVGYATHYHANYVVPYWASSLVKSANIGAHIFYRWTGGWGRPNAFTDRYAGSEPLVIRRRNVAPLPGSDIEALVDARDAAAAAAAQAAAAAGEGGPGGLAPTASVDSFNRAVIRRYEPLRRDTANAMITERARTDTNLTASQRWALTGSDNGPAQAPLGRRNPNAQPAGATHTPAASEAARAPAAAPRTPASAPASGAAPPSAAR